eukprot:scaffold51410_cov36-Prasinocladus_malaysianus.AAC.5
MQRCLPRCAPDHSEVEVLLLGDKLLQPSCLAPLCRIEKRVVIWQRKSTSKYKPAQRGVNAHAPVAQSPNNVDPRA